ncbi:MAG: hypothetical protein ACXADA_10585 [Candidatus Hodarchaeales archaeon]
MDILERIELMKKQLEPGSESLKVIKTVTSLFRREVLDISLGRGHEVVDVITAGSASRKTFLPGKLEIDLFIRLEEARSKQELEEYILDITPVLAKRLAIDHVLKYAENPYGHFTLPLSQLNLLPVDGQESVQVDLVVTSHATRETLPKVLEISGMARTPFHVEYLSKEITEERAAEIRVFKHWLKQKRVYGQASFTGFLAELLIIKFGTFQTILHEVEEISNLRLDFHSRETDVLEKKFKFPKILITDPIDPDRNAAGGIAGPIGEIKIKRFVSEARRSLDKPEKMFERLEPPSERLEAIIDFDKEILNIDEIFTRLGRIATRTANQVKQDGYRLTDLFIEPEENKITFVFNQYFLKTIERKGPPVKAKEHVKRFLMKHPDAVTRDGFLHATVKAKFPAVKEAVNHYLDSNENCRSFETTYCSRAMD